MINDKKLEEAKDNIFNKHFLKNNEGMICIDHISEPVYLDYQIKQAIELGAKWAINEFLKDLWHPMEEEPKLVGEEIIIEMFLKSKRHTVVLEYMVGKEELISLESVRWITDWNSFIQPKENVIKYRWCYLKDLLPKQEEDK